ncbi:MAG: LapA family protein, partial [Cyanobacteria bacterium P01_D01_bin.116]
VLGGLMLLLAQNWSPAVPLVFLGLRTKPISLAAWMLLSTTAGVFTSSLVSSLLQLSSRSVTKRQRTSYEPSDSPKANQRNNREKEFKERKFTPPRASSPQPLDDFSDSEDTRDDWDLDRNADDWDFEEKKEYSYSNPRSSYTKIQDDRDYEDFRESEDNYDSADSSYSYDKSDLNDSGVEERKKREVYDADYRVIVPPPNPSTTSNTSVKENDNKKDDDDWDFLDEDFDSDKKSQL